MLVICVSSALLAVLLSAKVQSPPVHLWRSALAESRSRYFATWMEGARLRHFWPGLYVTKYFAIKVTTICELLPACGKAVVPAGVVRPRLRLRV